MLGSYGLRTYIWNNRLKSLVLLIGFPFLLFLICFGFAILFSAMNDPTVGQGLADAWAMTPGFIPFAIIASLIWFVIAWFTNTGIVALATGAKPASRREEPRLWNILETLCISRGITMPNLRIIETPARNAFASGVRKGQYTITVTRGLMDALNDQELEAVLAHELTHIENRDAQLLVIAAVFVGIISLVGDLLIRVPRALFWGTRGTYVGGYSGGSGGGSSFGGGGRSRSSNNKGGGGAIIILILIAIAIFLIARLLAIALDMAMSRKREFLADAGAVELTKNPDAMITALRKIAGHSEMNAPQQIQEMFLDHPPPRGFGGWFATHPSIDARIDALVKFGGGHDPGPVVDQPVPQQPAAAAPPPSAPAGDDGPHPWGEAPPAEPWGGETR
ncbi:MAG TPA: M48 family metallopeptidase [Bauldia sp.]|nr:M48 family metallopeptidase [Bauldia sp.]